ncbi:MAG: threonylcarbamoyl-AMP synthase [Armatimonadetes bacterium]|nr:threonylcarbamoyl-AMP synthase [Armatimonadota bacterium]
MRLYKIDPSAPDPAAIEAAARVLQEGGLGVFPTETVYGLGANACNAASVERLARVKGRPADNPFSLLIGDIAWLDELAESVPPAARQAIRKHFPGPLTVVLQKSPRVPDNVTAGQKTVGIRMPDHPVALALVKAAGVPLAAPSANRSGDPPAADGEQAACIFGEEIDFVLDSGPAHLGLPSTVADYTTGQVRILRQGVLALRDLQ